jgi:hypothetical protein
MNIAKRHRSRLDAGWRFAGWVVRVEYDERRASDDDAEGVLGDTVSPCDPGDGWTDGWSWAGTTLGMDSPWNTDAVEFDAREVHRRLKAGTWCRHCRRGCVKSWRVTRVYRRHIVHAPIDDADIEARMQALAAR